MIRHFCVIFLWKLVFSTVLKYCEDYSLPLQFPIVFEYYLVSLRETRVHFWCVSMKVRGKFCISENIELLGNFVVLLVHFFFFF